MLLFLHVTGALLIFSVIAILIFGVAALRLATTVEQVRAIARPLVFGRKVGLEHISIIDVVTMIGILLTAASGLYMAREGGFGRGWIEAGIASFALMAPVGPLIINPRLHEIASTAEAATLGPVRGNLLRRARDPLLGAALLTLIAWLVGIVFLMTTKPSLQASIIAMLVALAVGVAAGVAVWRLGKPARHHLTPDTQGVERP